MYWIRWGAWWWGLALAMHLNAQEAGHTILFGDAAANLPEKSQRSIFQQLGYQLAPTGKTLMDPDCGEIWHETTVLDLNDDDVPEVQVIAGNSCTSGHTGSSVFLFVRDGQGHYVRQLGFPGASITPLATGTQHWPDLRIGTASFCEPVWAWKGQAYDLKCSLETQPGGCVGIPAEQLCDR